MDDRLPNLTTEIFSFRSFADAQRARDALAGQGFEAGALHLRSIADEAGPVQGNFVSGNGRPADNRAPAGVIGSGEAPYPKNFNPVVDRGSELLEVLVHSDEERRKAHEVAAACGGVEPA